MVDKRAAHQLADLAEALAELLHDPNAIAAKVAISRVEARLTDAMVSSARAAFRELIGPTDFLIQTQDAVTRWFTEAFLAGLEECGVDPEEITPEEQSLIQGATFDSLFALQDFANAFANGQIKSERQAVARARLYVASARAVFAQGQASGCANRMMRWDLGSTRDHCADCLHAAGQVHRMSTWERRGWLPQSRALECGGWNCACRLSETDERARGRLRSPATPSAIIPF
jgi:hypothetical protein